ncbi:MAG: recombinase family protein [Cyanobacteriota bacterium]
MKLLAYVRISTQNQDKGFSLESQKGSIKAYCSLYNHDIIDYTEDIGTGSIQNDGLKSILSRLINENLDGIIVDKIDRLFRNTEELLKILRNLKEQGKTFISVHEQFDVSTITGELSVTVLSAFAEFEKKRIRERILAGKQAKKDAGGFIGGTVPFGYRSESKVTNEGKHIKVLVPEEVEQDVIKFIHSQRGDGDSYATIAHNLNQNGYRTKRKRFFTATQVFRVTKDKKIRL